MLDENGNPIIEEISSIIPEEVMADMKNVWSVFDMEGKDQVSITELRTIMRALDVDVKDDYVLEQVRQMIDPENTKIITFDRLRIVMEDKMKETDTIEDLLVQLRKLDKDGDDKILSAEFKQYMKNLGNKMTDEELEEMMKEADPKGEGIIDINEFADRICPPKIK